MAIIKTMRHDTIYRNAPEYYDDAEENGLFHASMNGFMSIEYQLLKLLNLRL
jgi:hypothetical protein